MSEINDPAKSKIFSRRRFVKRSGKALLAAGLAGGIGGTLLAACGDTATPAASATTAAVATTAPATTAAVATTAPATTAAVATTTAASATTAAVATTTAASTTTAAVTTATGEAVEVSYTFIAFSKLPELQLVEDALNATAQFKKAALKIKLVALDFASYDQKLQLGYAAGEKRDVVFTAPWVNSYTQNSIKGNFLALDDLLQKNAPELYASMPLDFWQASKINGKVYGVPNQTFFAYAAGFMVRKDLAAKYNLDLNAISSYPDLVPFITKLKEAEPAITPIYSDDASIGQVWSPIIVGFDELGGGVAAVRYNDSNRRVFNMYTSDEFKQLASLRYQWQQAGYFTKDPIPAAQGPAAFKAGKYGMIIGQQTKPNDIPNIQNKFGQDFVYKTTNTPFLTTQSIQQNMNAIARTTGHPDKAIQFLNLLNTDREIFNLVAHGIEGKHYVFVDKAKGLITFPPGVTADTSGYNPSTDWMFGNAQNAYYTDPASVGVYDTIQKSNAAAARSSAFGFVFDPNPVKTEIAQIGAVKGVLDGAVYAGKINPQTDLAKYLDQLKQAGVDKVVAEVQKQLDAWAKTK